MYILCIVYVCTDYTVNYILFDVMCGGMGCFSGTNQRTDDHMSRPIVKYMIVYGVIDLIKVEFYVGHFSRQWGVAFFCFI